MTCEECTARQASLAASEQLLAEKRYKYRDRLSIWYTQTRLLGSYEDAVKQARANLERHKAECMEERR